MDNLKQARERNELDKFAKDREAETGDGAAFNRALASMAGKSKAVPEASKPDHSDD